MFSDLQKVFRFLGSFQSFWKFLWPETWHLRHWLHFWQLRTTIWTITLWPLNREWWWQHSQFLRCFIGELPLAVAQKVRKHDFFEVSLWGAFVSTHCSFGLETANLASNFNRSSVIASFVQFYLCPPKRPILLTFPDFPEVLNGAVFSGGSHLVKSIQTGGNLYSQLSFFIPSWNCKNWQFCRVFKGNRKTFT